jgi:hypothetical protein
LLDRIDTDDLARQIVTAGERQIPAHARMADEVRWGPGLATVCHIIDIFRRSVLGSLRPHPDEIRAIEAAARQRAAMGMPLEDMLQAFRLGMRLSWRELRGVAQPGEEGLLVVMAEAMLTFTEVITGAIARAYLSERVAPVSEQEREARQLMVALDEDRVLTAEQVTTIELLGLHPGGPFVPFALWAPDGAAAAHSVAARRLRAEGVLAVTEGARVTGLCSDPARLDAPSDAVLVVGYPVRPGGVGTASAALRAALEAARAGGRQGRCAVTDFAPDVFLAAAPDLADAVGDRVVAALSPDLRATLEMLVATGFDRGATAEALGIHRNSLRYRTARISAVAGIDLGTLPGQVTAYLAVRRQGLRAAARRSAARGSAERRRGSRDGAR